MKTFALFWLILCIISCIILYINIDGVMHTVDVKKTNIALHRRCDVISPKLTPTMTSHQYIVDVITPFGHPTNERQFETEICERENNQNF